MTQYTCLVPQYQSEARYAVTPNRVAIDDSGSGVHPLAFELFQKTGAFGNTFVFLMAGVVTDFTEFGIVLSNIGKRAAIALVAVTIPLVLMLGYLLNQIR